ncbi:MAG: hypothetical protein IKZ82_07795 [Clostridia bacterium]|nr:hypothetical protein [Clostridia bacterium]
MNKKETVYEALLGVKSEYLAEAEGFSFKKRRILWPRILGIAAAACLIIALAAIAITPKRDRDKWAANRPTSEPISTGGPITTGAPIETIEPIETDEPTAEDRLVFLSLFAAREFIESAKLSDAAFESYASENMLDSCGISNRADVTETLKSLQSVGFPTLPARAFDLLSFDRGGESIFVSWSAVYKTFSVISSSSDDGASQTGSGETFAVELDLSSPISELYGAARQSADAGAYEGLIVPEVYEFNGRLADGRYVRISSSGYSREDAEELIRSLAFGTLNELIESSIDGAAVRSIAFYSPAELAEFIASSELEDAEFASYMERSGFEDFSNGDDEQAFDDFSRGDDVRAFVNAYLGIRFPTPTGYKFDQLTLGLDEKKVHTKCYFPDGGSFMYTYYPSSLSGSASDMLGRSVEQFESFGAFAVEASPALPVREFMGISIRDFDGPSGSAGAYTGVGEYMFFGKLDGGWVELVTHGYDRSESIALIRSLEILTLDELAEGAEQTALVSDPWYLETAWEYADFANREYGFNFIKDEVEFSEYDRSISFRHSMGEEYINSQSIYIYFSKDAKQVRFVDIFGDASDRPEEYASMIEEERSALFNSVSMSGTYTVTREDMLNAGYTLDGTDADFVKIAEYCGRLKASELMSCNELHFYRCIEVDIGNVRRNTEDSVANSTDPVYCQLAYYFKPSYPKLFTDHNADIGCSMVLLDDAEHPGRISFWGDVLITETEGGWSCRMAYIGGY